MDIDGMILEKRTTKDKNLIGDHEHFCYIILCERCFNLFPRSNYIAEGHNCDLKYCCSCCNEVYCEYREEFNKGKIKLSKEEKKRIIDGLDI